MKKLCVLFVLITSSLALAQDATLQAPAEAVIGAQIEVQWSGPGNNYDSIYVISPDAEDSASGISSTTILNGRNPILLAMPELPGEYQLRYWDRGSSVVAAREMISVVDVPTSLETLEVTQIGATIEVAWEGPGNDYDKIGVYPPGAPDDAPALKTYTILNSRPATIQMPDLPLEYELRYTTSRLGRILARTTILVEDVESTVTAPAVVDIGATIEVSWSGPGNDYDRIELHEAGAADDSRPVNSNTILNNRNPVSVRVSEQDGSYELRYVTSQSNRILARTPLQVGAVDSQLSAPEFATAMMPLEVSWVGPGNDYDLIALYPQGAEDDTSSLSQAVILNEVNPVVLELPDLNGDFELRYLTTQTNRVLARRPIQIQPAGRLSVVFERTTNMTSSSGSGAVELILDASGSMLQRENGVRRIEIARTVLTDLVREHLSDQGEFALRVFGHREADSCRTDLEIPAGPLNREQAAGKISSVNAMNLARTPIADSLARVPSDLAGVEGPKTVVLITDGEETCEGDPAAVIEDLRASGMDVQVSVVGFAIDDAELRSNFESWAELGGGSYFDARSAEDLSQSLRSVISGPFQVFDSEGNLAGRGVIGGSPLVLPAGVYRVETVGDSPLVIDAVEILPGDTTEALF